VNPCRLPRTRPTPGQLPSRGNQATQMQTLSQRRTGYCHWRIQGGGGKRGKKLILRGKNMFLPPQTDHR